MRQPGKIVGRAYKSVKVDFPHDAYNSMPGLNVSGKEACFASTEATG